MKKINIFLDDIREVIMSHNDNKGLPYFNVNEIVIVRDYDSFVKIIDSRFDEIDIISFDHDLANIINNIEYTGKTATEYLINYCIINEKKLPNWYIHSDNIIGSNNIKSLIINYLKLIEKVDVSSVLYFHKGRINNKFVK
ncbi:MAG: hypothetical protein M0R46_13325 [Candidatus Muirbacterium halophilum]|nr:hypothetical protein [Candidatus Muirbacterium halophilum]